MLAQDYGGLGGLSSTQHNTKRREDKIMSTKVASVCKGPNKHVALPDNFDDMSLIKRHRKKKSSPIPIVEEDFVNNVFDKAIIIAFGSVLQVNSDSTTNDDIDGFLEAAYTCTFQYCHLTINYH